jgi:putative addiction module component (TIGR02574 family)
MAALGTVLEQALQLSDDERGELIARLLGSFEPTDGDEVDGAAWGEAWSAEIERRLAEVRDGTAELVDGDEARARIRAAIARRK